MLRRRETPRVGCGTGVPILQPLIKSGVNVYGVGASPSMIAALRGRYPQIPVECAAAKDSDLFGLTFDGVVACGRDARGPTP